jgi:hypothetical protein
MNDTPKPASSAQPDGAPNARARFRHSPWSIIVVVLFAAVVLGLLWALAKPALDAYQLETTRADVSPVSP